MSGKITHGDCINGKTKEYNIWCAMNSRCNNPNNKAFHNYGGRGIKVCERWREYSAFLEDMGRCPPEHSIERRDNHAGYSPDNCFWATRLTQANNKRNNVVIDDKTITQWSAETGDSRSAIAHRYYRHGRIEKPIRSTTLVIDGKTLEQWSKETGIKSHTIYYRYLKEGVTPKLFRPLARGKAIVAY